MKKINSIASVVKVLSCLLVAFALVISLQVSAHAEHVVYSSSLKVVEKANNSIDLLHSHLTAKMDCGEKSKNSSSESDISQCCSGLCMTETLVDQFSAPMADISRPELIFNRSTVVTADRNGLLRPPKYLI